MKDDEKDSRNSEKRRAGMFWLGDMESSPEARASAAGGDGQWHLTPAPTARPLAAALNPWRDPWRALSDGSTECAHCP